MDIVHADPDLAWSLLLELIQRARTNEQLRRIAVGEVETFVSLHWEAWTERIEGDARPNPRLRYCLSGIHFFALPETYQKRMLALADTHRPADVLE